jgi:hypothetical protein
MSFLVFFLVKQSDRNGVCFAPFKVKKVVDGSMFFLVFWCGKKFRQNQYFCVVKQSDRNGVCLAPFKINSSWFFCMIKTVDILGIEIIKVMEQRDFFSFCVVKNNQAEYFCVVKTV